MSAALAAYSRSPLNVRAGFALRALCAGFSIPVISLSDFLHHYPHHDDLESYLRLAGPIASFTLNLWLFCIYFAIMRGAKGRVVQSSLVFMFVGDPMVLGLLIAGFAWQFNKPIEKYEDSFWVTNLTREWQLQQSAMKKEEWIKLLVFSPLLWVMQLVTMGFAYFARFHGHKTVE